MSSVSPALSSWRKELYLHLSFNAKPVVRCICHIICKISLSGSFSSATYMCDACIYICIVAYMHIWVCVIISVFIVGVEIQLWLQQRNDDTGSPGKVICAPKLFSSLPAMWAGLGKVTAIPYEHNRLLPCCFSAYGKEEKYRSGNLSAQLILCALFSWHTGILLLFWATQDWYE